ncbi:LTA synthase family protein [Rheinheimera sp. UJ63]|uniref:LTA synthase family protein n=1 Tax=Rheinheimera sp. UJ63 TaxID=2910157 RepID=UPI001F313EB1|nr:LTA synthase family protein [Rheinheimera sp. UJ63]MCF4010536.1 LTA synthase family protein [Rheinheimera sp. UJ63]
MQKTERLIRLSGPYLQYLVLLAGVLLLLSANRLGLVFWQYERVLATGELSRILLQGVRADLIFAGIWLALPMLFLPLLAHARTIHIWRNLSHYWVLLGFALVILLEVSTPQFILQYDVRPNRLYIEYLKYPKEVFSTLWQGFRLMFVGGLMAMALLLWLINQWLRRVSAKMRPYQHTRTLLLSWPFVVFLVFAAIRSTTEHRPANPALFAITGDAMVNSLVINSPYSVIYALYSLKHEARSSEIYGTLTEQDMLQLALDWPWLHALQFTDAELPTMALRTPVQAKARPLNLVIILEESLGATFVEPLGGVAVTPELAKLKEQGWWFEQMYATGTRSVRGIEAVVAGFAPTPAQSVVKLSAAQQNFYTLASTLSQQGYHTNFVYGGESHFDNMRSFFTGNGFNEVIDFPKMIHPQFVGSWGASDEDLFTAAASRLAELAQQDKPFFSLIFTSSNHEPFEFPDDRIALHEQPKATVNNAVKYADYALGKFIAEAKKQAYWQNTVFLIVADHDNRVYGNSLVPVDKFHIPALILGADIQPQKISALASQIDLAPTLLSLLGISAETPLLGRDFSRDAETPGRALLQFDQYFALLQQQPDASPNITILKPDGQAVSGYYDFEQKRLTLSDSAVAAKTKNKALAEVLLPSWLYREQRYRLKQALE